MTSLDEFQNPTSASIYAAEHLKNGTLTLFLGAGTSLSFGLPKWVELVNSLRRDVGLSDTSAVSAEELQLSADEAKDKFVTEEKWMLAVQKHLYQGLNTSMPISALEKPLLISIAALLMGSKRGHVTRVVTLNFDTMLEWFLSIFGFVVRSVHQLPIEEGSEDVRIYHPHGCLPPTDLKNVDMSSFIILGLNDVDSRLGAPNDPWFDLTRHILNSGFCLFIGMSVSSLRDRALSPLLVYVAGEWKIRRPTGFWIQHDAIDSAVEKEFFRKNIVPLYMPSESMICDFLLKICQNAIE